MMTSFRATTIAVALGCLAIPRSGLAADPLPTEVAGRRLGLASDPSQTQKAAGSQEVVPRVRNTTKSFYGWQILATGGVGGLIVAGSVLLPERPLGSPVATAAFVIGMPAFALSGPIVHWTHDDFSKGLISFGGNFVFAVVGGFTGQALRCNATDAPDDCGTRGFFTGLAVASIVAPIIDAVVLGWDSLPDDDFVARPAKPTERRTFLAVPTLSVGNAGRVELGLVGRF